MHSQDHHSHPKRCSPGRPQNAPVNNGKHRSPDDNGTAEEDVWCDVPPVKEQASRQIRVFTPDASTPSSSTSVPEHCQIVVGSTPFSVPWAAPRLPATATTCVVYLTSPLQALHLLGTLPLLSFFNLFSYQAFTVSFLQSLQEQTPQWPVVVEVAKVESTSSLIFRTRLSSLTP
jgi:hypothetical protein